VAMCGLSLENHSTEDTDYSQPNHPLEAVVSAMRRLSLKDLPVRFGCQEG